MPRIESSALLSYRPEAMYDLVDTVAHYPAFLPWCGGARSTDLDALTAEATIDIDYRGLKQSFTTRNVRDPGRAIDMRLVNGPFKRLEGRWEFRALGEDGCRISLALDYEIASGPLATLLAPVFRSITETLVERFVARADALHATP